VSSFDERFGASVCTIFDLRSFNLESLEGTSDFGIDLAVFFCNKRSSSREMATPISVSALGASAAIDCTVDLTGRDVSDAKFVASIASIDADSRSCSDGTRWDSKALVRARTERRRRPRGAC
jgi:hypothetical protein